MYKRQGEGRGGGEGEEEDSRGEKEEKEEQEVSSETGRDYASNRDGIAKGLLTTGGLRCENMRCRIASHNGIHNGSQRRYMSGTEHGKGTEYMSNRMELMCGSTSHLENGDGDGK